MLDFLALPGEIRNIIYDLCLTSIAPYSLRFPDHAQNTYRPQDRDMEPVICPALLSVSKAIRQEALPLLFQSNTWATFPSLVHHAHGVANFVAHGKPIYYWLKPKPLHAKLLLESYGRFIHSWKVFWDCYGGDNNVDLVAHQYSCWNNSYTIFQEPACPETVDPLLAPVEQFCDNTLAQMPNLRRLVLEFTSIDLMGNPHRDFYRAAIFEHVVAKLLRSRQVEHIEVVLRYDFTSQEKYLIRKWKQERLHETKVRLVFTLFNGGTMSSKSVALEDLDVDGWRNW